MAKFPFLIPFVFILLVASCKEEKKEVVNDTAEMTEEEIYQKLLEELQQESDPGEEVIEMRENAEKILEYRWRESPKIWAAIESQPWRLEFIATGPNVERIEDAWFDFHDDHTFEFGSSLGVLGTGKYHFDNNTRLLIMNENRKDVKPREYAVTLSGDAMVWVGTKTYEDNHMQMKLGRLPVRPDKQKQLQ